MQPGWSFATQTARHAARLVVCYANCSPCNLGGEMMGIQKLYSKITDEYSAKL